MRRRPTRNPRLIAAFATLYALQLTLCALACLEAGDDASAVVEESAAAPAAHPCHEAPASERPATPDTPSSEDGCGCDTLDQALAQQGEKLATPSLLAVLRASSLEAPRRALATWHLRPPREVDLPPPDLLLLESILII